MVEIAHAHCAPLMHEALGTIEQSVVHMSLSSFTIDEVLVCGIRLNSYELTDQLQVGAVSNMYDILERMHEAAKVITV